MKGKQVITNKRFGKRTAIVLALTMLLTCFAYAMPVNAASTANLKQANVKWDLKNNKKVKFKTKWSAIGTKTHTVKLSNFKVKNAKKKGYKQCTYTLTYYRNLNLSKKQRNKIVHFAMGDGEFISPGGDFWYAVVDYKTGMVLKKGNKHNVKVTSSKWKTSDWKEVKSTDGMSFNYAKKCSIDIKIIYPKKYKNLAIGAGGFTEAPHWVTEVSGGSAAGWVETPNADKFAKGKQSFYDTKLYWSAKDKRYAHFKRVK